MSIIHSSPDLSLLVHSAQQVCFIALGNIERSDCLQSDPERSPSGCKTMHAGSSAGAQRAGNPAEVGG